MLAGHTHQQLVCTHSPRTHYRNAAGDIYSERGLGRSGNEGGVLINSPDFYICTPDLRYIPSAPGANSKKRAQKFRQQLQRIETYRRDLEDRAEALKQLGDFSATHPSDTTC